MRPSPRASRARGRSESLPSFVVRPSRSSFGKEEEGWRTSYYPVWASTAVSGELLAGRFE
jgi:hypothetical protein